LTVNATARLLVEVATRQAVSRERSEQMLDLMKRNPFKTPDPEACEPDQNIDFSGIALKPGMRLWSKAGWTNTARHDAAYIELPNGGRLVLVMFTSGHANERKIIPALLGRVIEAWPAR